MRKPAQRGYVPVMGVRKGTMQSVGPSESLGTERGRPAGQIKSNTSIPHSGLFGEPHEEQKRKAGLGGGAGARGEVSGPGRA